MFFPYVFSKSDDIFSKSSFMFHSYNFVPYFHIKRADIAVPLPIIAYIPITLNSLTNLCFIYFLALRRDLSSLTKNETQALAMKA